jgi:hypothetical protein
MVEAGSGQLSSYPQKAYSTHSLILLRRRNFIAGAKRHSEVSLGTTTIATTANFWMAVYESEALVRGMGYLRRCLVCQSR